jgi:hypothetical protein
MRLLRSEQGKFCETCVVLHKNAGSGIEKGYEAFWGSDQPRSKDYLLDEKRARPKPAPVQISNHLNVTDPVN